MKIKQKSVYEGKNIYSYKKCIKLNVDLEGYSEIPSKDIPNFNFNLVKIIPQLNEHRCGINEKGGFVKRLKEGTYLAHICEHIIIAIQNILDIDVSYGKAREIKNDDYYIIVEYKYRYTGCEACNLAVDLINSLINNNPIDFNERIKIIKEILAKEEMGSSTKSICNAAEKYELPVTELFGSGLYQIGYGKQSKIIEATIGNNTRCVSADISSDKLLTKEILNNQNIPVAEGSKVSNIIALLKEAESIGYPVVIKPQYGNKGKGVMVNLKNDKELIKAYTSLEKREKDIIIEKYIKGNDYRICVVDYKVVAVSLRVRPLVKGNGVDTVRKLIINLNSNELRGEDHEKPLTKIKIDEELVLCLNKQNINLNYIPQKDEEVVLRENANLSTGGIGIDCTDEICNENVDFCIRSAKALGLDICGIDICTNDISLPIDKNNGAIIEVNTAPGIRMHEYPAKGVKRNVGEAIINMLYKNNPINIPVISVTGTNGKTTTVRLISYVLEKMGLNVGLTSTEGIYINRKCIHKGDDSGFNSARTILLNRDVDAAVLETARGGIIRRGLAYNLADIAVITNITNDHLGIDGINTMEELSFAKSLVGEAVRKNGFVVINADDKYSRSIIKRMKSEIIYFSMDKNNDLVQENINNGKIAIFIEDNFLYVINNRKKYKIISVFDLPISYNNTLEYNIENAMAACAALVGLKVDYCMITKGFKEFELNEEFNSGRFNIFDYCGRKIILDYGHNIEGYKAVISALKSLRNNNDIVGVIGIPGDRKDEVADEIGKICSGNLDKIIIKEDKDRRGRKEGEIPSLIRKSIEKTNFDGYLEIILDEVEALKMAIKITKKDDVIVVFYEDFDRLKDYILDINNKYRYLKRNMM